MPNNNNYILIPDGDFVSESELYHHGVKGMKWGIRRYQNPDGSLTAAGKKRISKEYEKTAKKAMRDLLKQRNSMNIRSYNEAADYMNRGGINKFNADQRMKYGENYFKRDGYVEDYNTAFNKLWANNYNKSLNQFYKTNKNVVKGRDLIKKYDMTSWDDLAKNNSQKIEEIRQLMEDD